MKMNRNRQFQVSIVHFVNFQGLLQSPIFHFLNSWMTVRKPFSSCPQLTFHAVEKLYAMDVFMQVPLMIDAFVHSVEPLRLLQTGR